MTPDEFHKVERVFQSARALPREQRDRHVRQACGDDARLAERVFRLLAHDHKPRVNLDSAVSGAVRAASQDLLRREELPIPRRIGAYRILRQIGEGGFGVVYLAEQESPRRTVALKVVRWSAMSADALRRFEHETHVLGRLQHPGIAQIFEAGIAEIHAPAAGTAAPPARAPFYTMEYIQGANLLRYAESPGPGRRALDVRERLELAARVCDALEHAHQNGIIHRDLKPDNILVVDSTMTPAATSPTRPFTGQPKILDFGVARAQEDEAQAPMRTRTGQIIGTPAYMSPEQVKGHPHHVDTRSDVYAIGVLLYQLLTGRLPYRVEGCGMAEVIRVIEHEPPGPLRTGSTTRGISADVEAIVAKALAKDKERRYQSAAALASDLRRFLADEPIEAKRDSALYLLRKNAKRYRGALSAAAVFVALLAGFAVWATAQARINRRLAVDSIQARNDAIAQRNRANATAGQLAGEIVLSNIDRGRALASAGNIQDAERLLWHEYLRDPALPAVQWALREFYSRFPSPTAIRSSVNTIRAMALSPDGVLIAIAGDADGIEIWDRQTGVRRQTLAGHGGRAIVDLDFRPGVRSAAGGESGGTRLASAGEDGRINWWDCDTGQLLASHSAYRSRATTLRFDPGGRWLASGGADDLMHLWDGASGQLMATFRFLSSGVSSMQFSPDGAMLAVGFVWGEIVLFDTGLLTASRAAAGEPTRPPPGAFRARLRGHRDVVARLVFSKDGRRLVSTSSTGDRTIRVWDVETAQCTATLESVGAVDALALSQDARTVYAGGWFTIDVWDLGTNRQVRTLSKAKCTALALCDQDRTLVAAMTREIRHWDVAATPGIADLGEFSGRTVAFDPGGRWLATCQQNGLVQLRDPMSGAVVHELVPDGAGPVSTDRLIRTRSLVFDQSGRRLACASRDATLRLWNMVTRTLEKTVANANFVTHQSVAFSPDGAGWAFARRNGTFSMGPIAADVPPITLSMGGPEALSVCYSPDGRIVATSSREGAVRLWSAKGELLARLECGVTPWGLAFTPDGSRILAGTWGFAIEVWDVATHEHLRTLEGHSATVWSMAFLPGDPDVLASCSSDGTVRLWSVASGRNLATFEVCRGEEAIAASISPDRRRIAVACSNGEVRLLDLSYFDRCIYGNLDAQLARARASSETTADVTRLRAGLAPMMPSSAPAWSR